MLVIGIMSGTSLDGIDCALVEIEGCGLNTKIKPLDFISVDMPLDIKQKIKDACDIDKSNVASICSLNFELGKLFGESALKLIKKANIKSDDIDFIASHGQTIYHIPENTNEYVKSTLQIGDPSVISKITGCKVISNFRESDMAVGGTGAPLVPYVDYILFNEHGKTIALNNIGGISNTAILPSTNKKDDVIAFDTGPGNMIIDEVCLKLFNKPYDDKGILASQGVINQTILAELLSHPYLSKKAPKATGREDFGERYTKDLLDRYQDINPHDLLLTVTAFTAKSIVKAYKELIDTKIDKIIFCGGGAYNETLINLIKGELDNVYVLEDFGMSSAQKEAIQFAVLGNEFYHQSPANLTSVTGAKSNTILGRLTYE